MRQFDLGRLRSVWRPETWQVWGMLIVAAALAVTVIHAAIVGH